MKTSSYEYTKKYNEKRMKQGWVRRTFFLPKELMDQVAKFARRIHLEYRLAKLDKE